MNMIRGVVLLWCGATSYAFMSSLFGSGAKEEVGARRGVVIEPPRRLLPRSATHGVSEESWALYSGSTFTCGDGKVIPSSVLNDEFADCADGSDEPGTSAGGGDFICMNEGHRPIAIKSSRVDDSICDCCDGSDEGYRVECSNYCAEDARAEHHAKKGLIDAFEKGSASRKALNDEAKRFYDTEVARIGAMEEEVARLIIAKQALQEAFDAAEEERKKTVEGLSHVANEKIAEMLRLHDLEDGAVEQLVGAMLEALDVPAGDKETLIVDFLQSKGVEVKRSSAAADSMDTDGEYDPDHDGYEGEHDYSDYNEMAELEAGVEGDGETMPDEATPLSPAAEEGEENKEEEGVDLPIEHARDFVMYVLEKHSNYDKVAELVGQEHLGHSTAKASEKMRLLFAAIASVPEVSGREELAEANEAAASKEREVNGAKKYRGQYEKFQGGDDNRSIAGFLSGGGQHCIEFKDHTYDYSVCFGDDSSEAKQGHTSLGKFDRVELDEATGGLVIHFNEGDHCWNHGARVAEVRVGCGPENQINSVLEPSTCLYALDMVSPQACTPLWKERNRL